MSTSATPFPSQFILYIPTRSTGRDPFAQYLLINAKPTSDGKATRLDSAPYVHPFMPAHVIKKIPPYLLPQGGPVEVPLHIILMNINNNMPISAIFMKQMNRVVFPPGGGEPLLILRMYNGKMTNFLPAHLKRNIPLTEEKPAIITSPAPPSIVFPPPLTPVGGAGTAPEPFVLPDLEPNSHTPPLMPASPPHMAAAAVPAPKKAKKAAAPLLEPVGDLNPHVAKQLLSLARIRKEECPIIAEEFSEGNTAVMPCGHLFSRLGIEESFKKEPRKCPACRASGNPTLV